MGRYFYGKVTKSGRKLLINIPYDERPNFTFRSKVKVFLLDAEEIICDNVVRGVNEEKQELKIYDASAIIKRFDPHYSCDGKKNDEIIRYAKKLLEDNGLES